MPREIHYKYRAYIDWNDQSERRNFKYCNYLLSFTLYIHITEAAH